MVRLFGIGSPHGDDQLGWRLVQDLSGSDGGELQCSVLASPIDLLDRLDPDDTVIVADACDAGELPGTVVIRRWPAPLLKHPAASSHGLGLNEVLHLAEALRKLPRVVMLFAVQVSRCEPEGGLSPELNSRWPQIVAALRQLVAEVESDPG
jgi:hydrogenase maturation protease